jgi:glyoxylase-like metal-dependent hydrolase (beta-lactamase superfamily II)
MKLTSINTGNFKLDGGAMFGVVPKILWNKIYPSDENNQCTWALRCLLVETSGRKILIDCGIGNKQDEKFRGNYHLYNHKSIVEALAEHQLTTAEITDVVLTHLHFDHCGGAVKRNENGSYSPVFENALYWIGEEHWKLANNPNAREKASFLKENYFPLYEAGCVRFIENDMELYPGFSVKLYHGHTAGQVIPFIRYEEQTIVYMADFIPSSAHIPLAWVISYDTQPLVSLTEKEVFLKEAAQNGYILFFEHDAYTECCSVPFTEKGIRASERFPLAEKAC